MTSTTLPIRRQLRRYFAANAPLVIFDVGACEGEDSVRYARLFANARIVAVEPVPENLRRMSALLEREGLRGRAPQGQHATRIHLPELQNLVLVMELPAKKALEIKLSGV